MSLTLKKSNAKNKKYALVIEQKDGQTKTVNFGYSPMQDFTQHKDKERQENYLARHSKDPTKYDTPGELSRVILWSAPSLEQGIRNYERKHKKNLIVKL